MHTPLNRAQAKLEELERELNKYPDFHLYLLSKTREEQSRMERLLIAIPAFDLWRKLRNCVSVRSMAALCEQHDYAPSSDPNTVQSTPPIP